VGVGDSDGLELSSEFRWCLNEVGLKFKDGILLFDAI
jgi:hypothetical protein